MIRTLKIILIKISSHITQIIFIETIAWIIVDLILIFV